MCYNAKLYTAVSNNCGCEQSSEHCLRCGTCIHNNAKSKETEP